MERRVIGGVGVSERLEEDQRGAGDEPAREPEEVGQTAEYGRRRTSIGLGPPSGLEAGVQLPSGSAAARSPREPRVPSGEIVKICKSCLKTNDGQASFCLHCGEKLVTIASDQDDGRIGEVIGGKFTIVDFVDRGGMGEVYLGVNEPLGQRVAVKFLSRRFATDEHLVRRFLNEARSYCRVHHPNAVTLLDYGQHDDGSIYMVTEFVEGKNLTDTLRQRGGPLTQDQAVSVALQLCEVLSAAHHEGIIHRDLKPDNLMLIAGKRERFSVKVLDFGIAKITDEEDHALNTETGAVFGTPEFMSPEQARGDVADPRSDLYAVGLIVFYMLTGKLPFRGKSKFAVLNAQVNERPPRPSEVAPAGVEVAPALEAIILKCLNKRPGERYQDADDLHEALEALRLGAGSDTHPSTPRARTRVSASPPKPAPEVGLAVESEALLEEPGDRVDALGEAFAFDSGRNTGPPGGLLLHTAHADTLDDSAAKGSLAASIDLSHEHREAGTDQLLEEAGPQPGRQRLVLGLVAAVAIAVIAALAFVVLSPGGDDAGGAVAGGDVEGRGAEELPARPELAELERVMVTGQVVGLMAAAEDALRSGDLDTAGRLVRQTRVWVGDAALPLAARDRRRALEQRLDRTRAVASDIEGAVAQEQCHDAARRFEELRELSPGLARDLAAGINACGRSTPPSPDDGTPATQDTSPAPARPAGDSEPEEEDVPRDIEGPPAVEPEPPVSDDAPASDTTNQILREFNDTHGDAPADAPASDAPAAPAPADGAVPPRETPPKQKPAPSEPAPAEPPQDDDDGAESLPPKML